jgi:hypothetical protein
MRQSAAFPVSQWQFSRTLAAYSCGGSPGLGHAISLTEFPVSIGMETADA